MRQQGLIIFTVCAISMGAIGGCSKGCDGPSMDFNRLNRLRSSGLQASGPTGFLITPNPIDATNSDTATISDTRILNAGSVLDLVGLLDPKRLENKFLKVRIKDTTDAVSTLATPNTGGDFNFKPDNIHYSEVMAYRSLSNVQSYIEALGFGVVKSRPLYVMVQASGSTSTSVNAFYDHAYLNPSAPRTIKLYGSTKFAPGVDQDMYWHEFGHLFNESVSGERGIDYAGDNGAIWTEGSAIHECLADYLSESVSDKPYIGKWIARNLSGFKAGDPLRSAKDEKSRIDFKTIAMADGTGARPERYEVAEWCSRVLWEIREKFVGHHAANGAVLSDRLVYSAASLLKRDASLSDFKAALSTADQELHCGGFSGDINSAFESRGFTNPDKLDKGLSFSAEVVTVKMTDDGVDLAAAAPGVTVLFNMKITNTNGTTARNVRVKLEPKDSKIVAVTYMQAYGDIAAGKSISIGISGAGIGPDHSVVGQVSKSAARGSKAPYRLRLMTENGNDTILEGELKL